MTTTSVRQNSIIWSADGVLNAEYRGRERHSWIPVWLSGAAAVTVIIWTVQHAERLLLAWLFVLAAALALFAAYLIRNTTRVRLTARDGVLRVQVGNILRWDPPVDLPMTAVNPAKRTREGRVSIAVETVRQLLAEGLPPPRLDGILVDTGDRVRHVSLPADAEQTLELVEQLRRGLKRSA